MTSIHKADAQCVARGLENLKKEKDTSKLPALVDQILLGLQDSRQNVVKVLEDIQDALNEKGASYALNEKVQRVKAGILPSPNHHEIQIQRGGVNGYQLSIKDPKIIVLNKRIPKGDAKIKRQNSQVLDELKKQYGFASVKAAMQEYDSITRDNMKRGATQLQKADLERKINGKEASALKAFDGKEKLAFEVEKETINVEKLLLQSDKLLWEKALAGTLSDKEKTGLMSQHDTYHKHLQTHVDHINSKFLQSLGKSITKEQVLKAAYAAGGEKLVMKLLQDKTFTKSEAQKFFKEVVTTFVPKSELGVPKAMWTNPFSVLYQKMHSGEDQFHEKYILKRTPCSTLREVVRAYNDAAVAAKISEKDDNLDLVMAAMKELPKAEVQKMQQGQTVLTNDILEEKVNIVSQRADTYLNSLKDQVRKKIGKEPIDEEMLNHVVAPYKKEGYKPIPMSDGSQLNTIVNTYHHTLQNMHHPIRSMDAEISRYEANNVAIDHYIPIFQRHVPEGKKLTQDLLEQSINYLSKEHSNIAENFQNHNLSAKEQKAIIDHLLHYFSGSSTSYEDY